MNEHSQTNDINPQIPINIDKIDQLEPTDRSKNSQPSIDQDIEGVDIATYAQKNHLQVAEVWRRIRAGKIVARSEKGKLLIYQQLAPTPLFVLEPRSKDAPVKPPKEFHLKPKVETLERLQQPVQNSTQQQLPEVPISDNFSSRYSENSNSLIKTPEMALLLDHLSLAKEENKELLKMTRESIYNVTKMSERIVAIKDEIISEKNEQIASYKIKLAEQEKMIKMLYQKNEDLEMLAKTILDN